MLLSYFEAEMDAVRYNYLLQFREFLTQYNRISEQCFADCVHDFTTRKILEPEVFKLYEKWHLQAPKWKKCVDSLMFYILSCSRNKAGQGVFKTAVMWVQKLFYKLRKSIIYNMFSCFNKNLPELVNVVKILHCWLSIVTKVTHKKCIWQTLYQ